MTIAPGQRRVAMSADSMRAAKQYSLTGLRWPRISKIILVVKLCLSRPHGSCQLRHLCKQTVDMAFKYLPFLTRTRINLPLLSISSRTRDHKGSHSFRYLNISLVDLKSTRNLKNPAITTYLEQTPRTQRSFLQSRRNLSVSYRIP